MPCRAITVADQKGDTDKTATALSLGIALARHDQRVLLVNTDPLGDLTKSLGWKEPDALEAMKRQEQRTDLASVQVEQNSSGRWSRSILAEELGTSEAKVQRFMRLTFLIPEFLSLVDEGRMMGNVMHEGKGSFTFVENIIFFDHGLSAKAKGIYCQIRSLEGDSE